MNFTFYRRFVFLLVTLFLASCKSNSEPENMVIKLDSKWELLSDKSPAIEVDMPFSLLETLYKEQEIEDPNYEDGFTKYNINDDKYTLRKEFILDKPILATTKLFLELGRINGIASVYINDSLFSSSSTFYYTENKRAEDYLTGGLNRIEIRFKKNQTIKKNIPFQKASPQHIQFQNISCDKGFKLTSTTHVKTEKPFLSFLPEENNTIHATWNIPTTLLQGNSLTLEWEFNGKIYQEIKTISNEITLQKIHFPIENPEYWFPYTDGNPKLYTGVLKISVDGDLQEKKEITFGLKTLIWKNNKNQIEFILNNKPVDILSINFNEKEWYKWSTKTSVLNYIKDIKTLGINCIRVTSNQVYFSDELLSIFDEQGVFVWQDLHIVELPKTWTILAKLQIQKELISLCKTYRNHSSVLSLGGKSEDRSDTTKESGLIHYEIFEQVIPQIINTFSDLEYIPNSTFVWNDTPFNKNMLSMSSYPFLDVWLSEKRKDPYDYAWLSRLPSEQYGIDFYELLAHKYKEPSDLEALIYHSFINQNQYIDSILSIKRGLNPKTIHLPITYGESSPGIHPSITDYFGFKKTLFYTLLNQSKPISIHRSYEAGSLLYQLQNLSKKKVEVNVLVSIKNEKGELLDQVSQILNLGINQTKPILDWNTKLIPKHWLKSKFTIVEFNIDGRIQRFLVNSEVDGLDYPNLKYKVVSEQSGESLEIVSENFSAWNMISSQHLGYFEDNLITFLPGDTLRIPFNSLDNTYKLTSEEIYLYDYSQSY